MNRPLADSAQYAHSRVDNISHDSVDKQRIFGSIAAAIMGELVVVKVLTVLFLLALYTAWFKVKEPEKAAGIGL